MKITFRKKAWTCEVFAQIVCKCNMEKAPHGGLQRFASSQEMGDTSPSVITLGFLSNLQKSRKLFDLQTDVFVIWRYVLVCWNNAREADVEASCL